MLIYIVMLLAASAGYWAGKALWVRAVGAWWYLIPAVAAYLFALWMLLAAVAGTRGGALLFVVAIWGGSWLGRRLAHPRKRRLDEAPDDASASPE